MPRRLRGREGRPAPRRPAAGAPSPLPRLRGFLRPGVVWFGEPIDPGVLAAAEAALDCDLALAIGTSAVVYPAAGLLSAARARGAFTAEINPEATPATGGRRPGGFRARRGGPGLGRAAPRVRLTSIPRRFRV